MDRLAACTVAAAATSPARDASGHRQRCGFALRARPPIGVGREGGWKDRDGDRTLQPGIACRREIQPRCKYYKTDESHVGAILAPVGNYFPGAVNDVGFANLAAGDYRLSASSPYAKAATDGGPIGYSGPPVQ